MVLKINKKNLVELSLSLEGTVDEIFDLQFFFHELIEFHGQKKAENCGREAL